MNLAKADIFENAKKANAEIVIRNHEESIVCVSGFGIGFKEKLVFFVAFCKDTE